MFPAELAIVSQEHKKNFLSQLAAISKMSKEEVNRLVSDVVTGQLNVHPELNFVQMCYLVLMNSSDKLLNYF